MATWQKMISGCFGLADRKFAGHASDEESAFELLRKLRGENVGWKEFRKELKSQLAGMPKLSASEQLTRVRKFYHPWLSD